MIKDSNKFENEFSNLSTEDVFFISQVEKRINEHHDLPICLIAYDKQDKDK